MIVDPSTMLILTCYKGATFYEDQGCSLVAGTVLIYTHSYGQSLSKNSLVL